MRKVLFLTLSLLVLGGIQTLRVAQAEDADHRFCQQAAEEIRQTQALMERAAPKIQACGNDSARVLFARALRAQSAARETLSNHHCRAALRFAFTARRLTIAALKLCGDTSPDATMPSPKEPIEAPE